MPHGLWPVITMEEKGCDKFTYWLLKALASIRLATTKSRAEESALLLVSLGREETRVVGGHH